MADKDKHTTPKLSVFIAGRSYPIVANENEKPIIQSAVDEINQKISEFHRLYPQADKQDCMAMLLLTQRVELAKKTDTKPSDVSLESWVYEIKKILSTVSLHSV